MTCSPTRACSMPCSSPYAMRNPSCGCAPQAPLRRSPASARISCTRTLTRCWSRLPRPKKRRCVGTSRRCSVLVGALADARVEGKALPPAAVDMINRWAGMLPMAPQIGAKRSREWARPITARQVLATVARDAVELFASPKATRLRQCAGNSCRLIFVDTSRPGRRRWCSMERCGNRSKVSAFRTRRGEEEAT